MCIDDLVKISTILQGVATALAIFVGGIWAYYKFIKGRVFKPKIEISISSASYESENNEFIINTELLVKNLGLTKVKFDRESSSIRISKIVNSQSNQNEESINILEVEWKHISTFSILNEHEWIEPNEIIKDKNTFRFYGNSEDIYRIEAYLFTDKVQWFTDKILTMEGKERNERF